MTVDATTETVKTFKHKYTSSVYNNVVGMYLGLEDCRVQKVPSFFYVFNSLVLNKYI